MLSHAFKLGQPQIKEVDGKIMSFSPFGNVTLTEGLTPSESAYQKGKGKYAAEAYGKSADVYSGLQNQSLALDEMISQLDNPEFRNVTGPAGSFITKWAGTPQGRELLGRLNSASGEIALQVAPSLKGAFTGRDQTLINTIKANPNTDPADVFIGKLKAQRLINEALQERSYLAAQYIDNKMSTLEAYRRAAKETPLSKYEPVIDKLISHKRWYTNNKTGESRLLTDKEAKKLMESK
jgi:hypothetical protein